MSFGFRVSGDGEAWDGDRRELRAVELFEISVVSSWPAYEGTTVQARSRGLAFDAPALSLRRRYLETLCR